jgi:hypothetical protein
MAEVLLIDRTSVTGGRQNAVRNNIWTGMTFTPAQDTWLTDVRLYGGKIGTPPSAFRVNIYAVDGSHHPTGSVLDTVLVQEGVFSTSMAWLPRQTFTNGAKLTNGVEYAITFECDSGDGSNQYYYYEKLLTFYGLSSFNNGVTWSTNTYLKTLQLFGDDHVFTPPSTTVGRDTKARLIGVAENALWYEDV